MAIARSQPQWVRAKRCPCFPALGLHMPSSSISRKHSMRVLSLLGDFCSRKHFLARSFPASATCLQDQAPAPLVPTEGFLQMPGFELWSSEPGVNLKLHFLSFFLSLVLKGRQVFSSLGVLGRAGTLLFDTSPTTPCCLQSCFSLIYITYSHLVHVMLRLWGHGSLTDSFVCFVS